MKRLLEISLALGVVLIVVSIFRPITLFNREHYRDQVRTLYANVQPGMPRTQVRQTMDSAKYPDLTFHQPEAEAWLASTPLEFGARNWVLLIEFDRDRVSVVRIRTADSVDEHPVQAPTDKRIR